MCYKIPHAWSCGHTYAWSPVHCATATIQNLKPAEHCEQLMEAEDPNWKIKENVPCPECQNKEGRDGESEGSVHDEQGEEKPHDEAGAGGDSKPTEIQRIEHELSTLHHELTTLESSDLLTALQASSHHHSALHEAELEEARKRSLIDAPEQQSLDAYAAEMQRAREESQAHWEETMGMGVYRDHEEAMNRARMESYRELLEGYRRLRGEVGRSSGSGEEGGDGDAVDADVDPDSVAAVGGASSLRAASTNTNAVPAPARSRSIRWPFQDDDHRELYEDDDGENDHINHQNSQNAFSSSSSSFFSSRKFRESSREGAAAGDPAESFAQRPAASHASGGPNQAAGDIEGAERRGDPKVDGEDHQQRKRARSLLQKLRPGGSGDKK